MSEDIGPGDRVICMDASPPIQALPKWGWYEPLAVGAVYQIEDLWLNRTHNEMMVKLVGRDRVNGHVYRWRIARFRKITPGAFDHLLVVDEAEMSGKFVEFFPEPVYLGWDVGAGE